MSLLINGLFAQSLRYAQKIILGISNICLRLFFFACLELEQKSLLINRLIYQLSQFQNAPFGPISGSGSNLILRNAQCIHMVKNLAFLDL
jgi:hypothetical protein